MSQKKDSNVILKSGILVSVGIILILVSIFLFYQQQAFIKKASTSIGTIIGLKAETSTVRGRRSVGYCPVVKFVDTSGKPIQFQHSICANPQSLKVGEKVTVLYDPAHPQEAQISSFGSLWFLCGLAFGTGIFCGGMGLLVFKTRK